MLDNNSVDGKRVNSMVNTATLPDNKGKNDSMYNDYWHDTCLNDDNMFNNCVQDNDVNDVQLINNYSINSTRAHELIEVVR